MKLHFIAIGGSIMHNLAISMHLKWHTVSGSDDEVFEPSRSRLKKYGLLAEDGWHPERVHSGLDAIILGMHARSDNPELVRAKSLGIKIYSFPEFIYEESRSKLRVVVGGSHGKTTTTAMIMHVLKYLNRDFDYLVGAQLRGFDIMVKITSTAPVIIIEGDEYLSSRIDPRPKFHLYHANIGVITGIAWDHINVFPTYDFYLQQFRQFAREINADGHLIYNAMDEEVVKIVNEGLDANLHPFQLPEYKIDNGVVQLKLDGELSKLNVFGKHNLMNIMAAWEVCRLLDINSHDFLKAIASFQGAARRLETIFEDEHLVCFRDFAHAPSKVKASVEAVREQYPGHRLVACLELHTYSSLNKTFLPHYKDSLNNADKALVFFNPHAIELKGLEALDAEELADYFNHPDIEVYSDSDTLFRNIRQVKNDKYALLFMSSGDFGGKDLNAFATSLE